MPVEHVDSTNPDPTIIARAAALLRGGDLVSFPTETVYGLGANALDPNAVQKIYAAKGRPAWNPVIAHVPDLAAARTLSRAWPATAERLAETFWPGPLTLVVPKAPQVPDVITAGSDAVAVRVPDHPVALALLRAAAVPVAAPSANRFTQVSPTTAEHVVRSLGERTPLVLDGGPCAVGIESTVVDCTGRDVVILRPGMLGRESLEQALDGLGVTVTHAHTRNVAHDDVPAEAPRSPGMADRHYSPRGEVWLVDSDPRAKLLDELLAALDARSTDTPAQRARPVHALVRSTALHDALQQAAHAVAPTLRLVRMPTEPAGYARALYAALHEADRAEAALILIEAPPANPVWDGVRDRLTRAAR